MGHDNRHSTRRLVSVVCVAEILGMAPFAMFLALQPRLRAEWALSNTAAGWISSGYYAGYMVAVPFLAGLTDRIDARTVWLWSTALGATAALGFGLSAAGAGTALLFQLLAGISLAGTYMPGLKLIADRMTGTPHPRFVALYTTSFTVGSSVSFYLIDQLVNLMPWRTAIALAAAGPASAWLLTYVLLRPVTCRVREQVSTHRHWSEVTRSADAMRYALAYACHMWELFAVRAWIVPFLTFCASMRDWPTATGPATLAAVVGLVGVPASLAGAELSARIDRRRLVIAIMLLSAAAGLAFGLASTLPWIAALALGVIYVALVSADSAALTAGLVAVSPLESRGTAMAMYSMAGFAAAAAGSVAVGAMLDLLGGESVSNWTFAFVTMGFSNVIGSIALARGRH